MKVYTQDGNELMDISAIECKGNQLVVKGKVFESMPMSARISPAEARKGLRLLNVRLVFFLLTFLFRR